MSLLLASLILASGGAGGSGGRAAQTTGATSGTGLGTSGLGTSGLGTSGLGTSGGATTGLGTTGLGTTGLGTTGLGSTGSSATTGAGDPFGSPTGTTGRSSSEDDPRNRRTPRPGDAPMDEAGRPRPRIGLNAPYRTGNAPARTFDSGPFEGLESFGYEYFASARDAVEARRLAAAPRRSDRAGNDRRGSGSDGGALGEDPSGGALGRSGSMGAGSNDDQGSLDPTTSFVGPEAAGIANVSTPAPERYQLAPGDRLTVRFSSPTYESQERRLTVDSAGSVQVPFTGRRLTVRGLTLASAETAIARELRRGLRNAQVTVTLSELRSISVSIVGEVTAPGNYQMPATVTLFNALYAAGGPTFDGSFRRIGLRRAGGGSRTIDLYRFLLLGDPSQDVALQPGDVILVPVAQGRIGVRGEVVRPAVYELLPSETLKDAVRYAGGARPTAVLGRVQIASVRAGEQRQLVNADLRSGDPTQNPRLQDGDVVELFAVREELANAVTVEGAVDQPRSYALSPSMTVADLVEVARGLRPEAFGSRADLIRENPDRTTRLLPVDLQRALARDPAANLALQPKDRLVIYRADEVRFLEDREVEIRGAVRRPQRYERPEGLRVIDLLLQSGGLLPNASPIVFVQKKNPDGTEGPLVRVDVRQAAIDANQNPLLSDRDIVTVFRLDEAQYLPEQIVALSGAVLRPGAYPRSEGLTVRGLIELAGGLLPNAGGEVQISRSRVARGTEPRTLDVRGVLAGTVPDVALADGDVVSVVANGEFQEKPVLVSIQGRVRKPGIYAITGHRERLSDLVALAGGLLEEGWSGGAQFARDPEGLSTDAERRLAPRTRTILATIQRQEYLRALAKSDIDKLRAVLAAGQGGGIGISGNQVVPSAGSGLPGGLGTGLFNRETVTPARELDRDEIEAGGNVPVALTAALARPKGFEDVELRDGDILTIPERPTTVQVRGAVAVPSPIVFKPGQTLRYYLDQCGGIARDGDNREILVIRATGTITRAKPGTKINLGDTIYVPTKVISARLTDSRSDFESIIRTITNAGLVLAIIRSIGR